MVLYFLFGFYFSTFYLVFIFLLFIWFLSNIIHYLVRGLKLNSGLGSTGLSEMGAHVALEVEVSELISLLELEQLSELGIRVDLATIVLVLEIMRADVLVDLTRDLGASHLSALRLAQELSELGADKSGLYKTAGGTVALSTALLGTSL